MGGNEIQSGVTLLPAKRKPIKISDCLDVTPIKVAPISHDEIVSKLTAKISKVDFHELAHPGYNEILRQKNALEELLINPDGSVANVDALTKDTYNKLVKQLNSMGLSKQDYIIHSIEELLRIALANDWGMCKNNGFVYFYNGAFWSVYEDDELKTFLSDVAERMGIRKSDSRFYKFVDELFKQFNFSANMPKVSPPKGTTLVNLQNGTFEITAKVQVLRAPNRKDFLKYQLPFEYNPTEKAPQFTAFLNKVLPDIECQTVLAEYLGYVFIQSDKLKLEKMLFCYGSGANGKSVLFEIVKALLGNDNVCNYSLQSLTDQTGYYRANLANYLVNYASEINGDMESSYFKALSSGEPVEARHIYGKPFTIRNYAKFIFNGNTLPKNAEHTNAYFRRFLILPFTITIPPEEQDKDLDKKIIESELPGIFNWVLGGLKRLLEQRKFSKCDAADMMLADYKLQSDTVALFIDENNYGGSITIQLSLSSIHQEYVSYCTINRYIACSTKTLAERLRNLNFKQGRNSSGVTFFLTKNL